MLASWSALQMSLGAGIMECTPNESGCWHHGVHSKWVWVLASWSALQMCLGAGIMECTPNESGCWHHGVHPKWVWVLASWSALQMSLGVFIVYLNSDPVLSHAIFKWFEPELDKTNKMTFAPREDSDQPGHPPSLIRVFAVHMKKPCVLSFPLSEDSDQTAWMRRLIWIFVGHTHHFVGSRDVAHLELCWNFLATVCNLPSEWD